MWISSSFVVELKAQTLIENSAESENICLLFKKDKKFKTRQEKEPQANNSDLQFEWDFGF